MACGAHQRRGGFATHRALRLLAAGDLALGDHHGHARRQPTIVVRQVGSVARERYLAETLALLPGGHAFLAHHRVELSGRDQAIDQMLIERQLAQVAARTGDGVRQGVDIRTQLGGVELAQLRHFVDVGIPQAAHPEAVRFLGLGRGVVENVRLGRALELTHAEQVHVHAELVEQVLVEQAVVGQAGDHHTALRIDQDAVGMRGQVVLALVIAGRPHNHRFAGGAETIQRRTGLAQRSETAALQFTRLQQDAGDVRVLGGGIDGCHQIAQLDLLGRVARKLGQRALQRVDAVLLDQFALRLDHQHAVALDQVLGAAAHVAAKQQQQHDEQHKEENQIENHQPDRVDAAPEDAEKSPETVGAALRHAKFPQDVRDSVAVRAWKVM